jgi:hypothetical protein
VASSFLNEGLVNLWNGALAASPPPTAKPTACNLIAGQFEAGPTLTYAGLEWAAGPYAQSVPAAWTFGLQAGANYTSATATLTWTVPASAAGLVFYGVGLYDPLVLQGFYVEQFPAPWVVPSTGGTLTWTFNLNFGNCGSMQPPQG